MDFSSDSNALILPPKSKGPKQKSKSQPIISSQDKKLSKSQKRKLKKLEDEKQQKLLLSKSLETLEKYKISDDAHTFMFSSQNIGQAETMREKRRRVMEFSKAGLAVPENDTGTKRKKVGSYENDVDASKSTPPKTADNSVSFRPVLIERAVDVDASKSSALAIAHSNATSRPVLIERANRNSSSCSVSSEGPGELNSSNDIGRTERNGLYEEVDAGNFSLSQSPDSNSKAFAGVGNLNGKPRVDSSATRCIGDDPIQRPQIAPTVVNVSRPKEVEDTRRDLPIIMMEQEIMETINNHTSVIICGETGCGKTTQIPQFLYEAGYGSEKCRMKGGIIGVTQPRRVAVLSTAKRVAYELGLHLGKEVGFQVRHEKVIGDKCSIKVMTDGILLRELQSDFSLKRYSVIILDEAHERTLNTDILIGMLSRVIGERQKIFEYQRKRVLSGEKISPELRIFPLKLILMSATLRVEDFTSGNRIFHDPPPVIKIPTRQFPVTTHFKKKTVLTDYIGEAYKMVLKIHKKLPSGGILVFVTGQREVEDLCRKLRQASKQFGTRNCDIKSQTEATTMNGMGLIDGYSTKEIDEALDTRASSIKSCYDERHGESDDDDASSFRSGSDSELDIGSDFEDFEVDGNTVDCTEGLDIKSLEAAFDALTDKTARTLEYSSKGINFATRDVCSIEACTLPRKKGELKGPDVGSLHVLPLYAMLPAAAQLRVFEEPKNGERLVVVATNVAETSLTIPGIKYVVDTGREKVKEYNPSNGMESYDIKWISKASASQRAGRAGRTGPGHCYCLYTSAAMSNEFQDFACPEILKTPVEGVILILKSMGISKVVNFPFPTPPDANSLKRAVKCLKDLEALDSDGRLTPLGSTMAHYPMSPRHSRLLLSAIQITKQRNVRRNLVLGYAVAVAAALSSNNPFLFQFDESRTNSEAMGQEDDSCSLSSQKSSDQKAKLLKKQMKESSKLSRKKFSNLKSDALTVAYALQCFEQAKDSTQFCNENALNLKTMVDMSKLRKQLLQLVFNQKYCGLQQEFLWTHGTIEDVEDNWRISTDKNPLKDEEEDIICQAICAGWADRVAKHIKGFNASSEGDRKVNAIRYQASSSLVKETVFLRRWSPVTKAAPDYLVYNEMICTNRPYIHGVTSVNWEWLVKHAGSLCKFSAPLTDSLPIYDSCLDQVLFTVTPYFGDHSWELKPIKMRIKDDETRVKSFAYALLDGQVLPCLKHVKKFMAAPPSTILKPEALGQKRVGNLISEVRSRTIDSCARLREAWKKDPQLLHAELLDWFQDKYSRQFNNLWEKMHQEADLFNEWSRKKKHSGKG